MSINYNNNSAEVIARIRQAIAEAGQEAGITLTADVQANAPVDTGKLQKSYTFKKDIGSNVVKITVGTKVVYAPYVEFKPQSRGGRPHLASTLRNDKAKVIEIFKKHLRRV